MRRTCFSSLPSGKLERNIPAVSSPRSRPSYHVPAQQRWQKSSNFYPQLVKMAMLMGQHAAEPFGDARDGRGACGPPQRQSTNLATALSQWVQLPLQQRTVWNRVTHRQTEQRHVIDRTGQLVHSMTTSGLNDLFFPYTVVGALRVVYVPWFKIQKLQKQLFKAALCTSSHFPMRHERQLQPRVELQPSQNTIIMD